MKKGQERPVSSLLCAHVALLSPLSFSRCSLRVLLVCLWCSYGGVLAACGHVFCFWCVHKAMSPFADSHCPMCRRAFTHFPRTCALLHHLLVRAFPAEFAAREADVKGASSKPQHLPAPFAALGLGTWVYHSTVLSAKPWSLPASSLFIWLMGLPLSLWLLSATPPVHPSLAAEEARSQVSSPEVLSLEEDAQLGQRSVRLGSQSTLAGAQASGAAASGAEAVGAPVGAQGSPPTEWLQSACTCLSCSGILYQPVVLNCGHGTSLYVRCVFRHCTLTVCSYYDTALVRLGCAVCAPFLLLLYAAGMRQPTQWPACTTLTRLPVVPTDCLPSLGLPWVCQPCAGRA